MPSREELLYELYLAEKAGDDKVADLIVDDLYKMDQTASMSELLPTVATPASQKEQTSWEYVKDQMAKRGGDWVDILIRSGAAGAQDPRFLQGIPKEAQEELRVRTATNKSKELAANLFGYEDLNPQSETERWMGIAGAAAVDPTNVIPASIVLKSTKSALSLTPTLLQTTKPYFLAALEWGAGTASEVAGAAGAEVAQKAFEGSEYENTLTDHVARVATAFAAGTLPSAGIRTVQSGYAGWKAGQETVQENADMIYSLISNKSVNAVLDKAILSQGASFSERLKAAEKLQEQFPDLVLPLVDVVGENAILAKEFRNLYSKDPVFRQKYDEAAKQVKAQFDNYRKELLPEGDIPARELRDPILEEADRKAFAARKASETKLQNITNAGEALARKYDEAPLAANVEKAASNLSDSAEKAASEYASSFYTTAFKYAENNGIVVPPNVVSDIWNYSQAQRTSNLFADFPSLYRKINAYWSPREVEGSGILDAKGNLISPKTSMQFQAVSMEELDSLKRELNKAIRSTTDKSKQMALGDLKTELDKQIQSLDPQFAQLYKAADAQYYKGVGLPTSLEGYRAIDSAKFTTTVAEALTKPDQIRDYLNFVGRDAGIEVVRDAILMKARRSILTADGDVNPAKLNAFVARHREALNEVPEIRDLLKADGLLADRINRGRAKIESNYNTYAIEQSEGFFKALYNKNLDKIGDTVLSNPAEREKYLEQIQTLSTGNRKLALTGLRQSLLDKAFSSQGTTVEFIQKNKAAFNDVFGPEYSEQVQSLATLNDMIATNQYNRVASGISHRQSTGFKEITGVSQEEVLGTLRNQIMSNARKLLHLTFKVVMTKTTAKADKAMADVLLDTKGLAALKAEADALQEAMKNGGTAAITGKAFLKLIKTFSTTLGGYVTVGGSRGVVGSTISNDELENETSLLPTQEEDDRIFAPK